MKRQSFMENIRRELTDLHVVSCRGGNVTHHRRRNEAGVPWTLVCDLHLSQTSDDEDLDHSNGKDSFSVDKRFLVEIGMLRWEEGDVDLVELA